LSVSRYKSRFLPFALLIGSVAALPACENPNAAGFEAQLVTDTVTLVVPDPALPLEGDASGSALDICGAFCLASAPGEIVVRRPERVNDAGRWDVALRRRGGELVLMPPAVLALRGPQARAAVTRIETAFDDLRDASTRGTFTPDSVAVLRPTAVYLLRSRDCGAAGASHFAKLEALAVDVAAGTAQLRVVANRQCNDPRLAAD
jgi:hypothetical protein